MSIVRRHRPGDRKAARRAVVRRRLVGLGTVALVAYAVAVILFNTRPDTHFGSRWAARSRRT